jgi:phage tail P2-like protein
MPKTIHNMDYVELLPESMKQDKRYVALAKAVAQEERRIASEIWRVLIWPKFDGLSEEAMDVLRYDLNISVEEFQGTAEEKQKILQTARYIQRKAGTKSAVVRAAETVYEKTEIQEWFEYEGEPYHFRAVVDATESDLTREKQKRLLERLMLYKNVRSYLDGIAYTMSAKSTATAHAGTACLGYSMCLGANIAIHGVLDRPHGNLLQRAAVTSGTHMKLGASVKVGGVLDRPHGTIPIQAGIVTGSHIAMEVRVNGIFK